MQLPLIVAFACLPALGRSSDAYDMEKKDYNGMIKRGEYVDPQWSTEAGQAVGDKNRSDYFDAQRKLYSHDSGHVETEAEAAAAGRAYAKDQVDKDEYLLEVENGAKANADAHPQDVSAWITYGRAALARSLDVGNARDAFAKALDLDPRSQLAWAGLALADKRLGDDASSQKAALEAEKRASFGSTWLVLAKLAEADGDDDKAIDLAKRAKAKGGLDMDEVRDLNAILGPPSTPRQYQGFKMTVWMVPGPGGPKLDAVNAFLKDRAPSDPIQLNAHYGGGMGMEIGPYGMTLNYFQLEGFGSGTTYTASTRQGSTVTPGVLRQSGAFFQESREELIMDFAVAQLWIGKSTLYTVALAGFDLDQTSLFLGTDQYSGSAFSVPLGLGLRWDLPWITLEGQALYQVPAGQNDMVAAHGDPLPVSGGGNLSAPLGGFEARFGVTLF